MNRFFAFLMLVSIPPAAQAQLANPLKHLLRHDTAAVVRQVLRNPAAHRLQIIYTRIQRDEQGRPTFKSYTYRLRPREYFYPASTVKLPTVAAALHALSPEHHELRRRPQLETPLRFDSAFAGQTRVLTDSTAPAGRPTIGNYVRKVLLVSDNDAYNRLYEFVGQGPLNEYLRWQGLRRTRIIHRLSVGDQEPASRHTNPVCFPVDSLAQGATTGHIIEYCQPAAFNAAPLPKLWARHYRIGRAYLDGNRRVEQPLDFSQKNFFPLREQQRTLRAMLFQSLTPLPPNYAFLRKYLSLSPRLSRYPRYDPQHYPDNYAKFLLVGGPPAALPEGVRIYNKIGQAYGFLIDNACIVDSLRGVEFLLSAVIYCNEDEVLNDDQYDYDTVGLPFLRRLGQMVYQHELTRTDERRRQQVRAFWSAQYERAEP